jgi:hypothetical protein
MRRPPRSSPATATSIWGCSSASRRLPRPRTEENIQPMQQAAAPPPSLRAPPTALGKFGHRRKDLGPSSRRRSLFPQATCDLARGLASVTVPSFDPALSRRRRGPLCTGTPSRSRGPVLGVPACNRPTASMQPTLEPTPSRSCHKCTMTLKKWWGKGESFRVDRCRCIEGRCLCHIMSVKPKVTKTKTALKQETYIEPE